MPHHKQQDPNVILCMLNGTNAWRKILALSRCHIGVALNIDVEKNRIMLFVFVKQAGSPCNGSNKQWTAANRGREQKKATNIIIKFYVIT